MEYRSPLTASGWTDFLSARSQSKQISTYIYDLKLQRLATVKMTLYKESDHKLIIPHMNPYLSVSILGNNIDASRIQSVSFEVLENLSDIFHHTRSPIHLPPLFTDVRPLQWNGFIADTRYTYIIDLPFDLKNVESRIRKNIKKAEKEGYKCEVLSNADLGDIFKCIQETESRQGFSYGIMEKDLALLINNEFYGVKFYGTRSIHGQIVAFRMVLIENNGLAIDLIAAVLSSDMKSGVNQQVISFMLHDLTSSFNCTQFDFAGANLPSVSNAKSQWNGKLTPYFSIRKPSLREIARNVMLAWKFE